MKKIIYLFLVLTPFLMAGQTVTENFIKTAQYKVPSQTVISNPAASQATVTVTYFDGLGRPVQQVSHKQSGTGNDIVTPIEYDIFGRQTKEYLPFASSQNSSDYINPVTLIPDLVTQYKNKYGVENANPYSEKLLESSPLDRVLKQAAPGKDWELNSGHEIKIDYQTNDYQEVKLFTANTVWNENLGLYAISLSNDGFYPAKELYKTITYDENTGSVPSEGNGASIEFKNKEGQVVLKRTYGTVGTGTVNEKHDTYYVYDVYGNLTYVIPPKATDLIGETAGIETDIISNAIIDSSQPVNLKASNSITLKEGFHAQVGSTFTAVIDNGVQNVLDLLCYQYKYDYRNRLVEKKLPGKQWEFIIYDKLDRPIATGPANSPFSDLSSEGWLITKYDSFNRPILTAYWNGLVSTSENRKTLQSAQNLLISNFNETKIKNPSIDDTVVNGVAFRYSNEAWPKTDFHVLSIIYFDDYNYPDAPNVPINLGDIDQDVYYNNNVKPIGLTTGAWIRVPETSTSYRNEQAYDFFDAKGRHVRSYTKNFLGGYTFNDSKLDSFSGRLEFNVTTHKRLFGDAEELKTREAYFYTDQDRLLTQTHLVYGMQVPQFVINNDYDGLGRLISKDISSIQKIDYTYNIRGWLAGINDINSLVKPGDPKDLFAFHINYNNPTEEGTPLHNGNISQTQWKTSNSENVTRSYNYTYDKLNRLTNADFRNNTNAAENSSYFEKLQYDKNGNISFLHRSGDVVSQPNLEWMDYMIYNYNGNQLNRIKEEGNNYSGFTTQIAQTNTAEQYQYDVNGNMISDANKNITAISYNHLNLPEKITFATTGNIAYLYNAIGKKLQKIISETGKPVKIIDYLDGYQYENDSLKLFPTSEGYVEPEGSSYKYVYQYKDHLGNIRLSYDRMLNITEESNYYPFGLKHEGYNNVKIGIENKYKYNGKELQDELGLNFYDYGARNYDPTLGRWMNIDPMAEKGRKWSPFTYALNNPVYFIDPDGMLVEPPLGYDQEDGTIHSDYFGSWKYDKASNIWKSLGNACDVENIKKLNEVVVAGYKPVNPSAVAGAIVVAGGGPEDIPADVIAGITFTALTLYLATEVKSPPISITDDEVDDPGQYITLYRGVSMYGKDGPKEQYFEALNGIAIPNGIRNGNAHSDMDDHSMGDNESIWTSWSRDPNVARHFAKGPLGNSSGVVLTKRFKLGTEAILNTSKAAKLMQEEEWLVPGIVTNADPTIVK